MIIKHEKLGNFEVLVERGNVIVVLDNKKIKSMVNVLGENKYVLEFYVKKEVFGNIVPGIRIIESEYLELRKMIKDFKIKKEEEKYQEWLTQNVTYHCSYDFSTKTNYSKKAIRKVREMLINDENIKTLTGFGDYNSTETYEITNKELLIMLEKAEKVEIEVIVAERKKVAKTEEGIFEIAKSTDVKQLLTSYSVDCDDDNEACEIDTITVYALPNGLQETIRNHTW